MEALVGLGMIVAFIALGLNRKQEEDNKKGYCDL